RHRHRAGWACPGYGPAGHVGTGPHGDARIREDASKKADSVEGRGGPAPPEHVARVRGTDDVRADVGGDRAIHLENEDPRPIESKSSEGRQIGRSSRKRIDT